MTDVLSLLAIILYATATLFLIRQHKNNDPMAAGVRIEPVLAHFSSLVHGLSLWSLIFSAPNLDLPLGATVSLISLIVVLLFLGMRFFRPIHMLGVMVFPAAALSIIIGWVFPGASYEIELRGVSDILHMIGAGLAYALLSLALAQGLMLHAQDTILKNKQAIHLLSDLPSIQTMERTLFHMIYAGFILITLTLISGAFSSKNPLTGSIIFNHHTVLALLAWISLFSLILGNIFLGWRGRTVVLWTGAGFFLLALGYFGTRFILEVLIAN